VELRFLAPAAVASSITVVGIRAGEELPLTKRDLDREEIRDLSQGQDVPALLEHTPSMTWYSDSGVGSNYSYFSLRGIQQTRINMTLDGEKERNESNALRARLHRPGRGVHQRRRRAFHVRQAHTIIADVGAKRLDRRFDRRPPGSVPASVCNENDHRTSRRCGCPACRQIRDNGNFAVYLTPPFLSTLKVFTPHCATSDEGS
jgi:hypothetical protein